MSDMFSVEQVFICNTSEKYVSWVRVAKIFIKNIPHQHCNVKKIHIRTEKVHITGCLVNINKI
jgi:hypothetical protein